MKKIILSMMLAAIAVCGRAANNDSTLIVKLDLVDFGVLERRILHLLVKMESSNSNCRWTLSALGCLPSQDYFGAT